MATDSDKTPTIEELIETVKERKIQLASCCGRCHHCRASIKIIKAYDRYEEARLTEWPEEVLVCEKCGSMSGVGKFGPEEGQIDICQTCWKDKASFQEWLAEEMRQALDESPDYELQPDAVYKFIGEK